MSFSWIEITLLCIKYTMTVVFIFLLFSSFFILWDDFGLIHLIFILFYLIEEEWSQISFENGNCQIANFLINLF